MALQYFVLVTCAFFLQHRCSVNADQPVVYFPPFELRAVGGDSTPFLVPVANPAQIPKMQDARPERILHTSEQPVTHVEEKQEAVTAEKPHEGHNSSVNVHELLHALGLDESGHEVKESRAAARDYDYPQPYPQYPHQPSYGYPSRPSYPPNYGSYPPYAPPGSYHEPPYAYVPPTVGHVPAPVKPALKPLVDLKLPDLVKPIATKVAGKFSGLIGLVLSLLTGTITGDTELGGFKDLVINGIVKPLLVAKGGLKSLISKLTIPLISLLLINLEVLITVWWLWEDCEKAPVHQPAPYSYPKPAYSYNSYR